MFPRGILVNRSQVVSQDHYCYRVLSHLSNASSVTSFRFCGDPRLFFLVTLNYTTFGAQTLLNERTRVRRLMQMNIIVLKKL